MIADFHIHSKYSRATSKHCVPEMLDVWARQKGLDLIGTGDFTHAAWRAELRESLVPAEGGLYTLGKAFQQKAMLDTGAFAPRFMVSGEISCIYKKNGRVRKVHSVILLPSLTAADALAKRLEAIGNLHSDGRPILGLDCRDLLEITLDICPEAFLIPAHIWTPHFSLFGAYSGFDDIHECFEDLSGHIHALETGLSSDPPMNWRLSALDRFTLVSNSDAHSPANLAREANLLEAELSYQGIVQALSDPDGGAFRGTIEFFPEEGKYHYDGHRNCGVCQKPSDTIAAEGNCPACGGKVTVGVLHRVEQLADRPEGFTPECARPFESLVPLAEVIAASAGLSPASRQGQKAYQELLRHVGPELFVLRLAPLEDIEKRAGALVAEGIRRLRAGRVDIRPGYDGEYGKISIISKEEAPLLLGQLSLLGRPEKGAPGPPAPVPQPARKKEIAEKRAVKEAPPERLNPEQEQAVTASPPVIAVVAGPGTGKTKTLVGRIAFLIQSGVPAGDIAAVTFTNKAAAEMRARLEKLLGGRQKARQVNIGTFHGICLRLLAAQGQPVIVDEINACMLVKELLEGRGLKRSARDVLGEISLIKNGAKALEQADAATVGLYEAYCARLAQYGVLDYDDILLRAYHDEGCAVFPYLFVDEFQDTNPLQYKLLCKWSQNSKALFVIGDPDQSIYGFRGSDPNCFAWLTRDFPILQTIRLTQNYRSTPEILRCAAGVLHGPALKANRESGAAVQLLRADTPFSEALFVAKAINRLVGGMDMLDSAAPKRFRGFSDIAVLYRTNRQAQQLEQCLAQEGVPYTVTGRDEFLAAPGVRAVLAFFRYLYNPGDKLSLRVISNAFGEKLPALLEAYMPLAGTQPPEPLLRAFIEAEMATPSPALDKLLDTAVFYEDMPAFLHNLVLGQESDLTRRSKKAYASDSVSLMTLHAAKGLEFPVVFLCGVTEGLLPFEGRKAGGDPEEERRLFYVGVTRAQESLLLITGPNPSPFLKALPEGAAQKGDAFVHKPAPDFVQMRLF